MAKHERDSAVSPPPDAATSSVELSRYVLRLYVAGLTARSTNAITRLKAVCEDYLPGRYDLEIIDIYQQPHLAAKAQIIAVPTLVKELPAPLRKLIGDLSDKERILVGLDLTLDKPAR